MEANIILNRDEQQRLIVLNAVLAGQSTVAEAAASLGLSDRQVRRVVAAYRRERPPSPMAIGDADQPMPRRLR
jgi:hypothetical protein